MHPLIDAYLRWDHEAYLRGPSREPAIEAVRSLREALRGRCPIPDAVRKVESLSLSTVDPHVALMLLGLWNHVAYRQGSVAQMTALLHRARTLVSRSTPVEMHAFLLWHESLLESAKGNAVRQEELFRKLLRLLPEGSIHHRARLTEYAGFLAAQGRELEIDDRLPDDPRNRPMIALARFTQFVETGRIDEAARLLPQLENYRDVTALNARVFQTYRRLLDLMRTHRPIGLEHELHVLEELLAGRPERALEQARECARRATERFNWQGTLMMARAELSCGNADAAHRLIRTCHDRGSRHFVDDVLMARVERLRGNADSAAGYFSAALRSAEKLQAHGRVDFELRLAHEMGPGDLIRLTQAASRAPKPIEIAPAKTAHRLIGAGRSMRSLRETIERYANVDAAVLITGETGTGKELVAQALHESSSRRKAPFVPVNCAAISDSLLESELFGHERGAFTGAESPYRGIFESAGKGTVFLDEIGDISPRLQAALLRVLEAREVRPVGSPMSRPIACRIIAATNADLQRKVRQGTFRPDLFYRLQQLEILVPPLRDRREDIVPLAEHFLNHGRSEAVTLSKELRKELTQRDWPGNVRELRNEIERMRLLNSDPVAYGVEQLVTEAEHAVFEESSSPLRRLEKLRELFRRHRHLTRREIAKLLDVSPNTVTADLAALGREEFIEKVRPNRSPRTHYFQIAPR